MTILEQAVYLPKLQAVKNELLISTAEASTYCTDNGTSLNWYLFLSGPIMSETDARDGHLEDFIITLWMLFREELWPLFSLISAEIEEGDERWRLLSEGLKQIFIEAKKMAVTKKPF